MLILDENWIETLLNGYASSSFTKLRVPIPWLLNRGSTILRTSEASPMSEEFKLNYRKFYFNRKTRNDKNKRDRAIIVC